MFRRLCFAIAMLGVGAEQACAEIGTETRIERYDVSGKKIRDVFREIFHPHSKVRPFPGRYAGRARSNISWQAYWNTGSDGQCRLSSWRVSVSSVITMPTWVNVGDAKARERESWENYSIALEQHEQLHVVLSENAARWLDRKIGEMGNYPSCEQLEAEIKRLYAAMGTELDAAQLEYDDISKHGAEQEKYIAFLRAEGRLAEPVR